MYLMLVVQRAVCQAIYSVCFFFVAKPASACKDAVAALLNFVEGYCSVNVVGASCLRAMCFISLVKACSSELSDVFCGGFGYLSVYFKRHRNSVSSSESFGG